ncbi:MAG: hypothetical protein ACI9F2_000187 [Lysobacterales bacterium]|jgi:hypothetical protein
MEFSYGQGKYVEGQKDFIGLIVLAEHKLYLRGSEGDITQTYTPLEKIYCIKQERNSLHVFVRPSLYLKYQVVVSGESDHIKELVKDVVSRRGFKKRLLKKEWVEVDC